MSGNEKERAMSVTLHIDFQAGHVHSSVLAAYATDEERVLFHRASIDRVERSGDS